NTVLVDGNGQSEPGSTFTWKRKTAGRLRQRIALVGLDYIDGEVQFPEVCHRRRVVHVEPDYWIVLDELHGRRAHNFDFLYHFAPEAQLTVLSDERTGDLDCRARIQNSGLQLFMHASEAIQAEVICGEKGRIQGWASGEYGERRASPVLKAS